MEKVPCTKNILRTMALVAFMVAASGCSIIFPYEPPGCEPLNEICPDLACDAYQVEDGCAICECAEPVQEGCFSNEDCGQGERCNTEDFCDAPPGCEPGEPCPDVCYGRCEVADSGDCFSDSDCNEGEFCQFGFGPEPEPAPPPPEEGDEDSERPSDELIAESGQCVPFEDCDDLERRAPPECPDGFVLDVDFTFDPCGEFVCRPVGTDCSDLSADECEETGECRLERQGACPPCEPGQEECECFEELFCVNADSCGDIRDIEVCESTEGCRAVFPTDGGGAAPQDCFAACDGDDECIEDCEGADPLPPQQDFFCVEGGQEECFSDFDCTPGSECIDGQCLGGQSDCFELSVEECSDVPGCHVQDIDCDCEETDPTCFCEGFCVPNEVEPNMCISDSDCADDEACMIFEECRPCAEGENCEEECQFRGECVARLGPPPCDSDDQCGEGAACIDSQCRVGESLCLENADCPEGMRCATELDVCACPAGEECNTCFSICVEDEPQPND